MWGDQGNLWPDLGKKSLAKTLRACPRFCGRMLRLRSPKRRKVRFDSNFLRMQCKKRLHDPGSTLISSPSSGPPRGQPAKDPIPRVPPNRWRGHKTADRDPYEERTAAKLRRSCEVVVSSSGSGWCRGHLGEAGGDGALGSVLVATGSEKFFRKTC